MRQPGPDQFLSLGIAITEGRKQVFAHFTTSDCPWFCLCWQIHWGYFVLIRLAGRRGLTVILKAYILSKGHDSLTVLLILLDNFYRCYVKESSIMQYSLLKIAEGFSLLILFQKTLIRFYYLNWAGYLNWRIIKTFKFIDTRNVLIQQAKNLLIHVSLG